MINSNSGDFGKNPFKPIKKYQQTGPLVREKIPVIGKVWLATDHDVATQVLKNQDVFKVRKPDGKVVGLQWWMPKVFRLLSTNMLAMDPPEHGRLRGIIDQAFRKDMIIGLEPRIQDIADNMVSSMFEEQPQADIVNGFARHFPLAVICELLGLPSSDRAQFAKWAEGFTRVNGAFDLLKLVPSLTAMLKYLRKAIANEDDRFGAGLVGQLVNAKHEGANISDDELLSMIFLLLIAGHETTTHLISGGLFALLTHEEQKAWLLEDFTRVDSAVEELLRFVSPVQLSKPRYAHETHQIGGSVIKKGELVMALLSASNFDKAVFERPDELDLSRKPNRHMAFGSGIHFCLGHLLARIEGRAAFKAMFFRYPNLKLAVQANEVKWRTRIGLNALAELPVEPGTTY